MTRGAVHAMVKQVFAAAAQRCRLRGEAFESIAAHIEQASTLNSAED